jgi:hypothetical protein
VSGKQMQNMQCLVLGYGGRFRQSLFLASLHLAVCVMVVEECKKTHSVKLCAVHVDLQTIIVDRGCFEVTYM